MSQAGPRISYPITIDLGNREIGDEAEAHFNIENHGTEYLLIRDIQTSCSCTGLEHLENDEFVGTKSVTILPKSSRAFRARLSMRTFLINRTASTTIQFRTNDTQQPNCTINLVAQQVWGGTLHTPDVINIGEIVLGEPILRRVHFWDQAIPNRDIVNLISDSEFIDAVRLPPEQNEFLLPPAPYAKLVGNADIIIRRAKVGIIDATIEIVSSDPKCKSDRIRVFANVVGPIEAFPQQISLPRMTSTGKSFETKIVLRRRDRRPFLIGERTHNPGIELESGGDSEEVDKAITIRIDPDLTKFQRKEIITIQTTTLGDADLASIAISLAVAR